MLQACTRRLPGRVRIVTVVEYPPMRSSATRQPAEGGRTLVSTTSQGQTGQDQAPFDDLRVGDRENFLEGPPHELFRRLRGECPVHWSDGITDYPDEDGFWSVTTAEDVHEVSRDWQTFSSELGGFTGYEERGALARDAAGDVHRHGPTQARPPEGALPAGFHAEADSRARGRDQGDRSRRARPAAGAGHLRPGHRRRPAGRGAGDRQLHGAAARG